MNKFAFLVICILCVLACITVLVIGRNDMSPRDQIFVAVFTLVVLPALAWVNLRQAHLNQQHQAALEAEAEKKGNEPNLETDEANAIRASRNRRRLFVGWGLLIVGLVVGFMGPDIVLKGTNVKIGWLIASFGAVLIAGQLLGINTHRGTPLDSRLDS